jgi:glucose-1-phosphate adenylyltransferase
MEGMLMRSNQDIAANTLTFILAGGEGRRLSPLTKYRPKPLVPFGGCYRIVDFTLSNCLNSGLKRVYVLTQHEGESVGAYLRKGWSGPNHREFVSTSQPADGKRYAGTADAVLQNLFLLEEHPCEFVLILSADHVYRMDYRDLLRFHVASRAEATMAAVDQPREFSSQVGVLDVDDGNRVVGFEEKPRRPKPNPKNPGMISANMGIYVFNREVLLAAMKAGGRIIDFAHDIIPRLIGSSEVRAYRHEDRVKKMPLYWRDVGTPEAYYASSMDLLVSDPPIDPYNSDWPIRSAYRAQLDGQSALSKVGRHPEVNSIIPNGADIGGASVYRSVLFPGVVLESGADVRHSVLMPGVVIGRDAVVRRAIIDANIVIDAGDDIGCSMERDRQRFHALPNGVVIVSPDHLSPFFNKDVIRELRHVSSALSREDQVHF